MTKLNHQTYDTATQATLVERLKCNSSNLIGKIGKQSYHMINGGKVVYVRT